MNSQMSPDQIIAYLTAYAVYFVGVGCCGLIIQGIISWFLSTCLERIPAQFRQIAPMSPYLFLLGIIPCLGLLVVLIYNFIFWPKFCRSFKAYFDSVGNTEVGDCGEKLTLLYSVGVVGSILLSFIGVIPIIGLISLINCLLGPALLILYIVILVKAGQLKGMITDQPGGEIVAPPPPPVQ